MVEVRHLFHLLQFLEELFVLPDLREAPVMVVHFDLDLLFGCIHEVSPHYYLKCNVLVQNRRELIRLLNQFVLLVRIVLVLLFVVMHPPFDLVFFDSLLSFL